MNRQSMRLVVAPDKFKGSLTAVEAAEVIEELGAGAGGTGALPAGRVNPWVADRRLAETAYAVSPPLAARVW